MGYKRFETLFLFCWEENAAFQCVVRATRQHNQIRTMKNKASLCFFSGKPRIEKEMDESYTMRRLGVFANDISNLTTWFSNELIPMNGEKKKKEPLALIRLKSDAIPTIFPNCPAYLSKEIPNRRSGGATSENRLENYEQRVKEKNNILDEADKVESINHLLLKLDRSLLPDGVLLEIKIENNLIFFTISFESKPTLSSFACLIDDLSFTA